MSNVHNEYIRYGFELLELCILTIEQLNHPQVV